VTDNLRIVLVVAIVAAAGVVIAVADYWASVASAPVEACRSLPTEELMAECIAEVGG
jgi:hypothetical protein